MTSISELLGEDGPPRRHLAQPDAAAFPTNAYEGSSLNNFLQNVAQGLDPTFGAIAGAFFGEPEDPSMLVQTGASLAMLPFTGARAAGGVLAKAQQAPRNIRDILRKAKSAADSGELKEASKTLRELFRRERSVDLEDMLPGTQTHTGSLPHDLRPRVVRSSGVDNIDFSLPAGSSVYAEEGRRALTRKPSGGPNFLDQLMNLSAGMARVDADLPYQLAREVIYGNQAGVSNLLNERQR